MVPNRYCTPLLTDPTLYQLEIRPSSVLIPNCKTQKNRNKILHSDGKGEKTQIRKQKGRLKKYTL